MIKVGNRITRNKEAVYSYKDIKYDDDGWADASLYHPIDYDLLYLKVDGIPNIIRGWCSKNVWDGYKYKDGYKVLFWKKTKDDS